ncbi:hypothetical protein QOT17_017808 [Balamuthia mandrillaris]
MLVESNLRKERVGDETRSVFKRIEEGQRDTPREREKGRKEGWGIQKKGELRVVGDGRLWAISALRDQPWNVARDLFHWHYCLPNIEATMVEAITLFRQKPGESVHQLIDRYSVLCNHLPDTFYDYLKAFFFGQALLPHIKSKYKQQTLHNKPQDVIAAFKLAVLIETEFPQPSSKDKVETLFPMNTVIRIFSWLKGPCYFD